MYRSKENKYWHYTPGYKAECIKAALKLKNKLGMNTKQASEVIMVDYENLKNWLLAYNHYITTGEVLKNRGFKKVIPHLPLNNLELFDMNNKPVKKEVKKVELIEVEQPRKITILWGLITIN